MRRRISLPLPSDRPCSPELRRNLLADKCAALSKLGKRNGAAVVVLGPSPRAFVARFAALSRCAPCHRGSPLRRFADAGSTPTGSSTPPSTTLVRRYAPWPRPGPSRCFATCMGTPESSTYLRTAASALPGATRTRRRGSSNACFRTCCGGHRPRGWDQAHHRQRCWTRILPSRPREARLAHSSPPACPHYRLVQGTTLQPRLRPGANPGSELLLPRPTSSCPARIRAGLRFQVAASLSGRPRPGRPVWLAGRMLGWPTPSRWRRRSWALVTHR